MRNPRTFFEQVPLEVVRERISSGEITEVEGILEFSAVSEMAHAPELAYPQWQRPLQEALLELDPHELRRRIEVAEAAITQRMACLLQASGGDHERQALLDGLANLRVLKK